MPKVKISKFKFVQEKNKSYLCIKQKKINMDNKNNKLEDFGQTVIKQVSKTLEAARKLKGSIIVNDPVLYIH